MKKLSNKDQGLFLGNNHDDENEDDGDNLYDEGDIKDSDIDIDINIDIDSDIIDNYIDSDIDNYLCFDQIPRILNTKHITNITHKCGGE